MLLTERVKSRTDLVSSISLNHETSFCFCRDTLSLAGNVKGRDISASIIFSQRDISVNIMFSQRDISVNIIFSQRDISVNILFSQRNISVNIIFNFLYVCFLALPSLFNLQGHVSPQLFGLINLAHKRYPNMFYLNKKR